MRRGDTTKITLHLLINPLGWKSAHEQRCSKASIDGRFTVRKTVQGTDAAPPAGRIITRQTASNATSGQSSVLQRALICGRQSASALSTALAAVPTCNGI